MSGLGQRRAVLVDSHPLWLDAVEEVLRARPLEVNVGPRRSQDAAACPVNPAPDVEPPSASRGTRGSPSSSS
jgi:hypothetical protein